MSDTNPNPFAGLSEEESRNLLKGLGKAQDQQFHDDVHDPAFRGMFGAVFGNEFVDELEALADERMNAWETAEEDTQ